MHIHFISKEQIDNLKTIFAHLTSTGWVIPLWLVNLEFPDGSYEIVEQS